VSSQRPRISCAPRRVRASERADERLLRDLRKRMAEDASFMRWLGGVGSELEIDNVNGPRTPLVIRPNRADY
jgi:hypothetical protein